MSKLGQKVIKGVRLYAELRPDLVYRKSPEGGCQYIRDDAPSCLVGHGLWFAGLIDATFAADAFDNSAIDAIAPVYEWGFDTDEIDWLAVVQNSQDSGITWGKSVAAADGEGYDV